MKLLTEDQKKYQDYLEKSVAEYKKLWAQYEESNRNIMAINKLCHKNLLHFYLGAFSKIGWDHFKLILKSMHGRSFICKRIIKDSKEIV